MKEAMNLPHCVFVLFLLSACFNDSSFVINCLMVIMFF